MLAHHSARRVATELVCAAPSEQRLRRSSVAAALRACLGSDPQNINSYFVFNFI